MFLGITAPARALAPLNIQAKASEPGVSIHKTITKPAPPLAKIGVPKKK